MKFEFQMNVYFFSVNALQALLKVFLLFFCDMNLTGCLVFLLVKSSKLSHVSSEFLSEKKLHSFIPQLFTDCRLCGRHDPGRWGYIREQISKVFALMEPVFPGVCVCRGWGAEVGQEAAAGPFAWCYRPRKGGPAAII